MIYYFYYKKYLLQPLFPNFDTCVQLKVYDFVYFYVLKVSNICYFHTVNWNPI